MRLPTEWTRLTQVQRNRTDGIVAQSWWRGALIIDCERLFRQRLVVARFGEMDLAGWWNTSGQLGPLGAAALGRGFPKTHFFAQARSVFAVASLRCSELFDPAGSVTLWRLPATLEERFDEQWEHWLNHAADFAPLFHDLQKLKGDDLVASLRAFDAVSDAEVDKSSSLRRSASDRAVLLPGRFSGSDGDLALLALGFARGGVHSPAIPYARIAG